MKTILVSLTLIVLFATNGAQAQNQGDIRVNAGLINLFSPYGGDYRIGFGVGGEYLITDVISVAASHYLTNKDSNKLNVFSVDGRYYLMTGTTQVYGIAGISFIGGRRGLSETGLAVGAGAIFVMSDHIGINTELKYQFNKLFEDTLGLQANIGVIYEF
ncbi:MAG: outer membrane beta-barrel protein [Reichenbachiella sp.]|uniref:outer membrane beta-barrel protein n=1 Tax=Reichenbachiella sp. TaxID=2184521 RepID=UPI003265455A